MAPDAWVDNGIIKASFLEATWWNDFQNQWISSDTWAKPIAKYCITDITLVYNGTELDKCLNSRQNVLLREQMDMNSNIPKDHIGIFWDTLRKHGSKVNYYYYATEKGQLPLRSETKWYDNITDAKELLEKVTTRSTSYLTTISLNYGLHVTKNENEFRLQMNLGSSHQKHWRKRINLFSAPLIMCLHHHLTVITPQQS